MNNKKLYPDSSVEISGIMATQYEKLLNILTLGTYSIFISHVIKKMKIRPDDKIIDFGAGNGYNACKMRKYLSDEGEITGLDIGEDMIKTFRKKCAGYKNVRIVKRRIDIPLPEEYTGKFDRAFISFVLHGLPHDSRLKVIENASKALKEGGNFFILDYNEFKIEEIPFYKRKVFEFIECPYAFGYIKHDWKKILSENGFGNFEEHFYFLNMVRLLRATKIK